MLAVLCFISCTSLLAGQTNEATSPPSESWYARQPTWPQTIRASIEGFRSQKLSFDYFWKPIERDFSDSVARRQIGWVREDGIYSAQPLAHGYTDSRIQFDHRWQYAAVPGPARYGLRSDQAGASVRFDFLGTSVGLNHPSGGISIWGVLTEETGKAYGLARIEVDGKPVPALRDAVTIDALGQAVINMNRGGGGPLVCGLLPGRHRLTLTNLGSPSEKEGSTAVVVGGFAVDAETSNRWERLAWRYADSVRGGEAWRQRAAELASGAKEEKDLAALEELYFASREFDELAAPLRTLVAEPPTSAFTEREKQTWTPRPETQAYLAQLASLKNQVGVMLSKADAFQFATESSWAFQALLAELKNVTAAVNDFFHGKIRELPPIIFFTGSPLRSESVPNYVWQSEPQGSWGCSIRQWDPAAPAQPARVIFEDPQAIIFDLNLSYDAKTVFFSMRRNREQCWQIYEMGIDGRNLKQITKGPHYNVCPVPLPDGRLAFLSSRTPGYHTVCQSGPSMHVYVMNRDGSDARDLSSNTLTDFGLNILQDGRLIFTRWEYVDVTLTYRQSLWTQHPDGRQFELYFGNTIIDPATFWQAREIPGRDAVVCTLAPHHHSPYGAIGIVKNRFGVEAPRDEGFRWITKEFPSVIDQDLFWAYRDPYPVGENLFLVSYGGGGAHRFRIFLLDDMDHKALVYEDPATSCFYPMPVRPRPIPSMIPDASEQNAREVIHVPAAPPGQPKAADVPLGKFMVMDVCRGLTGVERGSAKFIRIMEQLPKTVNRTWNTVYDQGPLMGASSYYAKRVWGNAPVEKDGSAYFEAPAMKEIYFQLCDADGRELQRMTSAVQLMPGEIRSCVGCHENRTMAPPSNFRVLANKRPASPLAFPEWGNAGILDYNKIVQPVLDRNCVRCHQGGDPAGGVLLTGGYTRFFNMSYDNLVIRTRSEEVSRALYTKRKSERPMVQSLHLLYGIMVPFKPLLSGSMVSRLPDYFQPEHCKQEVPLADRRRVYEWIDAMIPYYPTSDFAHMQAKSNRDKWGDRDSKALLPWFTDQFAPVYNQRCASCHGRTDKDLGLRDQRQWAWIDLTNPESSPALTAHLAKAAGGRGIPAKQFQFSDAADPDYQALLAAIAEGGKKAYETPEADMPGFINRSGDCYFHYNETKSPRP